LERTKELAEKKVELMIAEGKDKIDATAITGQRMEDLAAERRAENIAAAEAEAQRAARIKEQLGQLGDIEGARVWPENLGQETAKAMQPEEERPAQEDAAVLEGLDAKIAELMKIKEMALQKIQQEQSKTDDKGKEEEDAVPEGPATDKETAAMFESDLLIPALRRQQSTTEGDL
jgi:hypothetical protein